MAFMFPVLLMILEVLHRDTSRSSSNREVSFDHSVFLYILLLIILLILQDSLTYGKPYDMWSGYQSLIPKSETDCDINDGIETLCQKCAKQTKSNVVYPMCCQNREEAREWCQKYISFGLQ